MRLLFFVLLASSCLTTFGHVMFNVDMAASNCSEEATDDDGSCEYETCVGCTDPLACNYNSSGLIIGDNSTCEYPAVCQYCSGEQDGTGVVLTNLSTCDSIQSTFLFASEFNPPLTDWSEFNRTIDTSHVQFVPDRLGNDDGALEVLSADGFIQLDPPVLIAGDDNEEYSVSTWFYFEADTTQDYKFDGGTLLSGSPAIPNVPSGYVTTYYYNSRISWWVYPDSYGYINISFGGAYASVEAEQLFAPEWNHLVVNKYSNTVDIWLNNELVSTTTDLDTTLSSAYSSCTAWGYPTYYLYGDTTSCLSNDDFFVEYIGASVNSGVPSGSAGQVIDNLQIFNRSLTQAEIEMLGSLSIDLVCSDPLACNYSGGLPDNIEDCVYPEEGYDCEGNCLNDADGDGICDDVDDCVGAYDACGVCNGPGEIYECGCADIPAGQCDCQGSMLDAIGVCGGDCTSDLNNNGICDMEELAYGCGPANCGQGTIWDEVTQKCIPDNPSDLNFDGCVDVQDFMGHLAAFGSGCEEEIVETPWECGDALNYQGYDYATVLIGDQCWFAENLRSGNFENGDAIPAGLSASEWSSTTAGATAVFGEGSSDCYTNTPDGDACDEAWSLNEYGRLYNWYAVDDSRGLCPSGWHVPTDGEWMTMEMALGMSESEANSIGGRGTDQGTQMKTTYGWAFGGNGTNSSGFSALPSGFRDYINGYYSDAGSLGFWWSSSPDGSNAWCRFLFNSNVNVYRDFGNPQVGFSVRCIREAE